MSSNYSFTAPNGNVFLQSLHISPPNATSFGQLPSSSDLNAKYWKKIYTDRNVSSSVLQASGMRNDGSFFIAGTFDGKKSAFPSQDGPTSVTGNDIYLAIVGNKLAFDNFGNIRIFGDPQKDWKNPLTTTSMGSHDPQLDLSDMPNNAFILSKNGKWAIVQDTELSRIGENKVYYVVFNPIHSGEGTASTDSSYMGTNTFKKWYNSQIDSKGNPDYSRLQEPLVQKYCELISTKPSNGYKTGNIPYQSSFSGYPIPQEGDANRNYADQSCYITTPKEGVYGLMGGAIDASTGVGKKLWTAGINTSLCSDSTGSIKYSRDNRPQSFINDYIKDNIYSSFTDHVCPQTNNTFCSIVLNSAGDTNIKSNSKVVNDCGNTYPQLIPPPPTPIDCSVSGWTTWNDCSAPCGGGKQTRNRTIMQPAQYGGKDCSNLSETQVCNTQACPTTPPPTTPPPTTPPPTTPPPTTPPPTTPPPTPAATLSKVISTTAPTLSKVIPTLSPTAAPTTAPSSSKTMIIVGVVAVAAVVGFMMMRKK
jgi:hypothetical protein